MENEKMVELLKNHEFLEKIMALETPEEVQKAFKDNGVEVSIEEVKSLGDAINTQIAGGELDEDALSDITGGIAQVGVDKAILGTVGGFVVGGGLALCTWGGYELKRKIDKIRKKLNQPSTTVIIKK